MFQRHSNLVLNREREREGEGTLRWIYSNFDPIESIN